MYLRLLVNDSWMNNYTLSNIFHKSFHIWERAPLPTLLLKKYKLNTGHRGSIIFFNQSSPSLSTLMLHDELFLPLLDKKWGTFSSWGHARAPFFVHICILWFRRIEARKTLPRLNFIWSMTLKWRQTIYPKIHLDSLYKGAVRVTNT